MTDVLPSEVGTRQPGDRPDSDPDVRPDARPDDRPDLGAVLARRLAHADPGPLLRPMDAAVLLDGGPAGAWTLRLARGRIEVVPGAPPRPATTIRADGPTLAGVLGGTEAGVAAFLDGRLTVRGNLALGLQLDGLFSGEHRPARFPRAEVVHPAGIKTAYLEAGPRGAPPVVLLHGLGATNASMLPTLWDLATTHRVIAPDLPGFGASAAPHGPYTPPWFARWLVAFLAEVGAAPSVLIGNSLGGRVALEAALEHPSMVEKVVLLCPSPAFRRLRQFVPVVRLLRPSMARLPIRPWHGMVIEGIRAMFSVPDRLSRAWYDAAADEFLRVYALPRNRVAFMATLRQIYLEQAYGDHGFWTRLPSLAVPALFVWGDRDRLVPASFARHVEKALPAAGSVVLEDCGHVPQFEHPAQVTDLVRSFLSR